MRSNRKFSQLYAAMAAVGMTVEELAQRMGKSKTYVQNRLSGQISWSIRDGYKIMKIFGQPAETMLAWFTEKDVPA